MKSILWKFLKCLHENIMNSYMKLSWTVSRNFLETWVFLGDYSRIFLKLFKKILLYNLYGTVKKLQQNFNCVGHIVEFGVNHSLQTKH